MILPLASDDTMTSVDSKIPVASKSVSVPLHAASNPHKATPQMSRAPRLNPYPVFPTATGLSSPPRHNLFQMSIFILFLMNSSYICII